MMTLKVWNTLSRQTRIEIVRLCGHNAVEPLLAPYHHNFDYDMVGKRLKDILSCCYFRPSDKQIVVSIEVSPTYETASTKKVVKASAKTPVTKAKTSTPTIDVAGMCRMIDAGYSSAVSVLPSIIKKFGDKYHNEVRVKGDFEWNHRIDGFYLGKNNKVYVDIYWQGDSTDGNDSFCLTDKPNGCTIPAESYFDGNRTRTTHGDLRVDKDEIYDAIKKVKDVISPKQEVKKVRTCCVCGKPLTKMDTDFYDLESYCIDCAIADGIRTSK